MGKIVPPIEEPHAMIPKAKPLRFLNQCEMTAGVEPNMNPEDSYRNTPQCQKAETTGEIATHPYCEALAE